MSIMKNSFLFFLGLIFSAGMITSCGDDDTSSSESFDLNISGLEDLGSDYAYEGWIMVDGSPKTTGTFTVDTEGNLSATTFNVAAEDLEIATAFILTIEPSPDNDPAPSDVHILAGDFSGNSAALTIDHGAALGNDFTSSNGTYILATPTDNDDTNEDSGIWFLDNSSGMPVAGLDLPTLPAGWAYEGWAVINGAPVSTGTFTSVSAADDNAIYSGINPGPPFPGEDFLQNAPNNLSFPTSLNGGTAVISIEPVPDNSIAPFALKPLVGMIPASANVHEAINMDQNLDFPTGTVNR